MSPTPPFNDPLTPEQEAELEALEFGRPTTSRIDRPPKPTAGSRPPRSANASSLKLGYGFAPVPRTVLPALRRGELALPDLLILVGLYERTTFSSLRVRLSLEQLAAHIGWTQSLDYLSKRLRRLRELGWIDYTVPVGRSRALYEIRLRTAKTLSDETPNSPSAASPSSRASRPRKTTRETPSAAKRASDLQDDQKPLASPSSNATRPNNETAPDAVAKPLPGDTAENAVRPPQTNQSEARDVYKGSETSSQLSLPGIEGGWRDV